MGNLKQELAKGRKPGGAERTMMAWIRTRPLADQLRLRFSTRSFGAIQRQSL